MVKRSILLAVVLTLSACGSCFDPDSVLLQGTDTADFDSGTLSDLGGISDMGTDASGQRDAGNDDMSMPVDTGTDMGAVDMSTADMGAVDMSTADMSIADMTSADMGPDACVPETAATICAAASAECGDLSVTDNCSTARTVDCGTCGTNANCQANVCVCDTGYEPSGNDCVDVDECQLGTDACDANADCINQPGTYDCECIDPYVGDGFDCVDPCGDGTCDIGSGETYENCAVDCSDAVEVVTGILHSCALLVDGSVRCWGAGISGQLGNGGFTDSSVPVKALISGPAVDIGAAFESTCAVLATGTVECWGQGDDGELGNGTMTATTANPVAVSNLTSVDAVDGGDDFFCAWAVGGDAWCWGLNGDDKLGIGVVGGLRTTPAKMALSVNVREISLGDNHGCLLDTNGAAWCWGRDLDGAVGNGAGTADVSVPENTGLSSIASVGVGDDHSCAVSTTGELYCWGLNDFGQLGDQTIVNSQVPISVTGLTDASRVAGGSFFTCAVKTGGGVECWGEGTDGQLGNGSTVDNDVHQTVLILSDAVDLDLGDDHACALRSTGEVTCWGQGSNGALGNGGTANASVPQAVSAW